MLINPLMQGRGGGGGKFSVYTVRAFYYPTTVEIDLTKDYALIMTLRYNDSPQRTDIFSIKKGVIERLYQSNGYGNVSINGNTLTLSRLGSGEYIDATILQIG